MWTRAARPIPALDVAGDPGERGTVPEATHLADVVLDARRGDRRAFAELYARFVRVVHAVVLARVAPHDAADLVQDVFVIALERLPELVEPAAFPGWLLTIARHRASDHARRPRAVELTREPAATAVPVAEARRVLVEIQALPDAYRETLLMRLVEGLTGPEIAVLTGLSPGSVRVNLHRGMRLLRERLGIATGEPADEETS